MSENTTLHRIAKLLAQLTSNGWILIEVCGDVLLCHDMETNSIAMLSLADLEDKEKDTIETRCYKLRSIMSVGIGYQETHDEADKREMFMDLLAKNFQRICEDRGKDPSDIIDEVREKLTTRSNNEEAC